ncbi:MAG: hypothetical protein PHC50_04335 [Candidatus Cloacimonetes bacterium]|nr:hypothetical protein [Candidatus Cloacimonadota bacterium]
MADMKISITLDAKELMRQLGLTKEEIAKIDGKEIKIKADQAASGIAGLRTALAETTLAFAGVLKGVQMLSKAIQAVVKPAAEMEQLRLRLEAMYRDADKAKDAFDEFRKVAAKTPATLMQVAEAGAQLKAFGMEAEYTIEVAANLAAYMGIDIVDAANAMGRAFAGGAGSAEQLRRRGILELISSFTGIEDLTKLTLPEFRDVLIETLSDPAAGIAGTAETMAESYTGAVSNMQDAMYQLGAQIGNAFMPTLTQAALGIGNLVNSMLGLATEQQRVTKATFEQRVEFELLISRFTKLHQETQKTDEQQRDYQKTLEELLDKYPNYLSKQVLEKGNWAEIAENIGNAREELDKYLKAQVEEAILKDNLAKLRKAQLATKTTETDIALTESRMVARGKQLTDVNPEGFKLVTTQGYIIDTYGQTLERQKARLNNLIKEEEEALKEYEDQRAALLSTYPEDEIIPPKEKEKPKGTGAGAGANIATSVKEEVSETAQAYAKLLENLKKYHSDAALANLDAHQKKLAILASEMDAEQRVVLDSMAAKEITEEEGLSRLNEIRGKYEAQAADVQKQANDEIIALAQKRIEQAIKDEESYYETMKFADEGYFEWKRKKIEDEVDSMSLSDDQKMELIRKLLDELNDLKKEYGIKNEKGGDKPKSWFFGGILGFDPDDPADQAKVQAIKDTFNTLFSQTTSVASGLLRLSIQRRDAEIAALEERAGKEGWENERLLAEKQKITKAYAEEERRYKRIQRALAITQATINVAEGVTKALAMGPIIGPILAGVITTMGAVQIGIIKAQKFAQGGLFRGIGGPRDDANLALLSDGEFVVNAASTKKYLPLLKQINEPGQPTLSSLDKGLLRTIAADYNMVRFFASPWVGVSQLRAAGKGYADGGLVGGGVSDAGLSGSAGGLVSCPAPDIERKVDTIIDKLDIINLNLVKKKVEVVVQGGSNPASIREMDASRLRMGERGYVPSA